MQIPERVPGLKPAAFLVAVYAIIWIALEGNLGRVLLLGLGIALVSLGFGVQQMGGRRFSRVGWLLFAGFLGIAVAVATTVFTLLLMALKTGLHAHGPEFTIVEIEWVLMQFPWWTGAGMLAGLGLGLIALAVWAE